MVHSTLSSSPFSYKDGAVAMCPAYLDEISLELGVFLLCTCFDFGEMLLWGENRLF